MTDLGPVLNELLQRHSVPTIKPSLSLQHIDEFLKEAYRINAHIASLTKYLREIRQSYLSTVQPSRHLQVNGDSSRNRNLTDRQKDEVDAETKQVLRELNASIRNLADAEQLRQNTQTSLIRTKYGRKGLGMLGNWAAGGAAQAKTFEQELEEAKASSIKVVRENILWYLRQKLQECGGLQASMMETRIMREMEKNRSILHKAKGRPMPELGGFEPAARVPLQSNRAAASLDDEDVHDPDEQLSSEQLQIFEKENQDMLQHYQATLDQVRTAEKSLVEISELQTQLVGNLAMQSAHIEQLVADSFLTAENVGGGNKQLKRAAERPSTAKYVFYASCGLSLFLIVYDLII